MPNQDAQGNTEGRDGMTSETARQLAERAIKALEEIRPQAFELGPVQERIIDLHEKLTEALEGPFGRQDRVRQFASDQIPNFESTVPLHPNPRGAARLRHRAPDVPRDEPKPFPIEEGRNGRTRMQ